MESQQSPPPYENVIYVGKQNQETTLAPDSEKKITLKCQITLNNLKMLLHIVNTLTHFLLGGVVLSAIMIANSGPIRGPYASYYTPSTNAFKQHIYLCVTGYMVLMSQAILSFNPHGGWAHALQNTQKRMIHASMQVLGSILALVGCIIKIADSYYYYPTLSNGHAVTGWIVMFLTIFSLIGGILNFKYNEKISQGCFKNAHAYLGYLVIFMAFLCLALAFGDGSYYFFNSHISSDLSITFTVFALIGLLISASSIKMK